MGRNEALSASLEDYLEAILIISESKGAARSKDISQHLGVKRPSVAGALRLLSEKKLVNYTPYQAVTFTEDGRMAAENVFRRHEALRSFFTDVLQLDASAAEDAACKLEHGIPEAVVDRLDRFVDFMKECPRGEFNWRNGLAYNCNRGADSRGCELCLTKCVEA
jgi:DtxR family Mn-dependent transcriptional regulator